MRPFTAERGVIVLNLEARERSMLELIPALLAGLGAEAGDPAAARLNPPAYPRDEEAQAEYARLMEDDLVSARDHDRDLFDETLRAGLDSMGIEQAEAWVRVIGDARLVIAARSGIAPGDSDWEDRARTEPDLALVAWLGYLQGALIEAIVGLETTDH